MLTVNGLAIEVMDLEKEILRANSFFDWMGNGYHASSNIGSKVKLIGKTKHSSQSDALALLQWLDGSGEVWNFESATEADQQWGSKGTGANSGSAWASDTTNEKYGTYGISIAGASSQFFRIDTKLADGITGLTPDDYTVMFWRKEGAGTQYHYAYVSDNGSATQYRNAVAGAYTLTNTLSLLTGTSGYVSLLGKAIADGTTNVTAYYDELIILPYAATASMVSAVYNKAAAMSSLPILDVKGDAFGYNGYLQFLGRCDTVDMVPANVGTGFAGNVSSVAFELIQRRVR